MGKRCRVCGLRVEALATPTNMCYLCQSAYQRFRADTRWGTIKKGGFQTVRGKLVFKGPVKEVPNIPSGNWFRYIVRERLLRGLCRYPYTKQHARSHDAQWRPDKMPPWGDVHTVPWDYNMMDTAHLIGLEIVDVPVPEDTAEPEGYVGPWSPPDSGL